MPDDSGPPPPFDARAALAAAREERAAQDLADNWRAHFDALDAPRQAWADLVQRQTWHWFCTLTFRPQFEGARGGVHPEKGNKAFRLLLSTINRELYGTRWYKRRLADGRMHDGLVWALGTELHKSGRIHFHALLACQERDLNELARRLTWMDWWHEHFGIARIEPPRSQDDICGYVSKYVAKDGEVDLSANFGRVLPPALFGQPGQESGLDHTQKPTAPSAHWREAER